MGHVARLRVGIAHALGVVALAFIIDLAVYPLIQDVSAAIPADSPWHTPVIWLENALWLFVPMLLVFIALWIIWGSVPQERREEARRVRPP